MQRSCWILGRVSPNLPPEILIIFVKISLKTRKFIEEMFLKNRRNQQREEAKISPIDEKGIRKVSRSKNFGFDWTLELQQDKELYKIYLLDQEDKVLGLLSLRDFPEELRIHINLIEVSKENRGQGKHYDRITGCLLAFACEISVTKGYQGFLSLVSKTKLIEHYCEKYGFKQYGPMLAIEPEAATRLIAEFL